MNTLAQTKTAKLNPPQSKPAVRSSRRLTIAEVFIEQTCRLLRALFGFRAYRVIILEPRDIGSEFDLESCSLPGKVLHGSELEAVIDQQEYLTAKFVAKTQRKGDWCFAFYAGQRLVSSGWYSSQPTRVGDNFMFEFPQEFVYMYRGFTDEDQRGARLHGYGMAAAARVVAHQGKRGLVGIVEAQNHASLRSTIRLGYRSLGTLFELRLFGRLITLSTPACRRLGCRLLPPSI